MHVNLRHRRSQQSTIKPYRWPGASPGSPIGYSKPVFIQPVGPARLTVGPNPPIYKPLFQGHIV